MSTALAIDLKKYGRLLAQSLPVVIDTEDEYQRLLAQAERLMEWNETDLSPEEAKWSSLSWPIYVANF